MLASPETEMLACIIKRNNVRKQGNTHWILDVPSQDLHTCHHPWVMAKFRENIVLGPHAWSVRAEGRDAWGRFPNVERAMFSNKFAMRKVLTFAIVDTPIAQHLSNGSTLQPIMQTL